MRAKWWLAIALSGALACERPTKEVGESCASNGECKSDMCLMDWFGSRCVQPCGGNDRNCPAGQRCSGRAEGYVAFCEPDLRGR